MESQRYVNLACQQGYISPKGLKQGQSQQREEQAAGRQRSLWEILQEADLISPQRAREVEAAMDATQAGEGLVVEDYRLQERIGSGGMGDVYLGVPLSDEAGLEQVAVKLLPRRLCADPEHLQRFVRETKALAQLSDEHFTRFIGSGQIDNRPYLIMELVRGVSLKERLLQQGALRQYEAVSILSQLSGALIKAEDMRVVHRDLKPANILIAPPRPDYQEPFCAKICDFGLVKFLQERADSLGVDDALTMSGIALGTPHYMSPEQATGERHIDHRSDMYSLAASIYHAMMGRTLFSGKTSAVIMYKQVTAAIDVEPLRDRGCGDPLIELLRDMLRKEPDERPSSWRDIYARSTALLDELSMCDQSISELELTPSQDAPAAQVSSAQALLDQHPSAVPGMPMGIYRARRRALMAMSVLAVVMVTLVFAVIAMVWPAGQARHEVLAHPHTLGGILDQIDEAYAASDHSSGDVSATLMRVVLSPGTYSQTWQLGPAHRGLHIQALGPGVILDTADRALLRLAAGAQDVVVHGPLRMRSSASQSLLISAGSQLHLHGVEISGGGQLVLDGGQLTVHDSQLKTAIQGNRGSELEVIHSTIEAGRRGLRLAGSVILMDRVAMLGAASSADDAALFDVRDSTLRLDTVVIDAAHIHTALATTNCAWVELQGVRLTARHTAWLSRQSTVAMVEAADLRAGLIGLSWEGRRDDQWQWSRVVISAPQPSIGTTVENDPDGGPGAHRLGQLPRADGGPKPAP